MAVTVVTRAVSVSVVIYGLDCLRRLGRSLMYALTSLDVWPCVAWGRARLPCLGLFRLVSFTDRFTEMITDLLVLTTDEAHVDGGSPALAPSPR
jgi:hypothetical protein